MKMDNSKKYFKEAKEIINQNRKFVIRQERVYELKEGKTDTYLSTITPYSRGYLNEVFKMRRNVDKRVLVKILKPMIAESVKLKEMYDKYNIDYIINYFFEEI